MQGRTQGGQLERPLPLGMSPPSSGRMAVRPKIYKKRGQIDTFLRPQVVMMRFFPFGLLRVRAGRQAYGGPGRSPEGPKTHPEVRRRIRKVRRRIRMTKGRLTLASGCTLDVGQRARCLHSFASAFTLRISHSRWLALMRPQFVASCAAFAKLSCGCPPSAR